MKRKVLIIGLDCATPQILFDQSENFPVLSQLMREGIYGPLRSADPPITIPAWMVMATGRDAGRLGLYGFRHRQDYSYHKIWIATSYSIKEKTLWDYIGEAGGQSVLVSIPPSYPPKPVAGNLISCFITPGDDKEFTYPQELGEEITSKFGPYIFDVEFRTDEKDKLLENIYQMTRKRFEVLNYLITTKPWDLFMFVEIGLDRVHHAFWKYMDSKHHLYTPGNPYEGVILDYYRELDSLLGELISQVDKETVILVVSDHGAKRMKGAFCINEWLIEEGYLVLKQRPSSPTSFDKLEVDWSKTKAWGWGGYYARIFLNIAGREQQGIIPPEDYEKEREILLEKLLKITGPKGEPWQTKVIKPQEYFPELNGDYPDLMVYFDDLYWRSAGTLGHGTMYLEENDTGPDDAVHDFEGIFILYDPFYQEGRMSRASILDITPTVLHKLGLPFPPDLRGKVIN
ncbi:alkaline phosphatase family protein [Candidatus Aminicenantes bacterium AC-334-K16]|nr:alkaline phosphatase family protein [Candidatus Aminicenantes bacterium AC-334-K16]